LGLVVNLLNFERDKEIYASQAEAVSKNMASDSLPPGGGQGLTSAALTK
jgi:hypothetical protein